MLFKLLTAIGVALALYGFARRALGLGRTPPAAPRAGAAGVADLIRCGRCGSWRAPGPDCACHTPPTP